jgi:hypothetical protein
VGEGCNFSCKIKKVANSVLANQRKLSKKSFFQEQEDAILEDDTEAEAVGNVRQALEAKLGARRLEAEIQACCFSVKDIYSNFAFGFAGWCGPEVGKMATFYL